MEIRNFTTDIDKFLNGLEETTRSKVSKVLHMLIVVGSEIEMPYSKSLGGGLFELRVSGKISIRIIYCFHENCAILLHAFAKKTDKIAKKELDLAKKRQTSIL
ncbi:type II toxin-antitoxin system RelE/ParE family toxin [Candidatus Nomurabacteria bacterium]|nr:type II toxin-antitoxin system RelE/ParE family toxin [Candidatus Nomurabacteria bacterium]